MSITTKILSNSLIGLVSVLPALLIMPAVAEYTPQDSYTPQTEKLSVTAGGTTISGVSASGLTSVDDWGTAMSIKYADPTDTALTLIENSLYSGNESTGDEADSGAFNLKLGNVRVENTKFENNEAKTAGAIYTYLGNKSSSEKVGYSKLVINNSVFEGNIASGEDNADVENGGGAIVNVAINDRNDGDAGLWISNSQFIGNKNTKNNLNGGGAINSGSESRTNITNTEFVGNTSASRGGAISGRGFHDGDNVKAVMDIIGSTFKGNTAATTGGAIDNTFYDSDTRDGSVYIANTTFGGAGEGEGNSAANGGAIYNHKGVVGDNLKNAGTNGKQTAESDASLIQTGNMYIADSTFSGNTATANGGAIYNEGILSLVGGEFTGNQSNGGNGNHTGGGAIYNKGSLTLNDVEFTSNKSVNGWGGGALRISTTGATETNITDSVFTSNTALGNGQDGGAISLEQGRLIIDGSTFSGNKADEGGAIETYTSDNYVQITDSTFENNESLSAFGALGVFGRSGVNTITDTIFEANHANRTTKTPSAASMGGGAIGIGSEAKVVISGDAQFINNTSATEGGAIDTRHFASGDNTAAKLDITGATFTGNKAGVLYDASTDTTSESAYAAELGMGGAISNYFYNDANGDGYVKVADSTFDSNSAVYGGAIYNHKGATQTGNIKFIDSNFTGNIASEKGGAIYNEGVTTIAAEGANVTFSGNEANHVANDIYNTGTLNLTAAADKTISLAGGIDGLDGTVAINGAGTVDIANALKNQTVTQTAGELHLNNADLTGSTIAVGSGATLNSIDNLINDYMSTITLADGALIKGDIDFENGVADKYSSETGTVTYKLGNLIGAVGSGVKNIQVASSGTTVNKDAGFGWFNSVSGLTLESSGSADGMIKLTGLSGGISEAADASAVVNEIKYDVTADEALTASKSLQNSVVLNGDGTGASGKELELAGADLTATDGANVTINDLKLVGTGALNNAATAIMRINDSSVGIKLRNAGILYSDPTTYSDALINTGIANIAGDTFASTGSLENYNIANLSQDGANKVTFDAGATISGSGTTNLVSGQTIFNNTVNTNTVKVASGADFDGALSGGTLDTHNGTIDTITGSFGGGALVLDAKFAATNTATNSTIDTLGDNTGTIKELNILGTSYGDANTVSLGIGSATLDPNVQINGMNYYTKVEQNGTNLTFSDKLINESNLDAKLGAWTNGNNIKQSSSIDHAADGTTYMNVGQALSALDTAIGDRQYATNGGYTGALLSNGQTVANSILAIANQTDTNTTDIATKANIAGGNAFTGAQTITNAVDNGGAGNVNALVVTASDTDAANGGTDARTTTLTVNSNGVAVVGGLTTDTLSTTGNATIGGTLTATAITVGGNAVLTTASELGSGNIADNAITTSKLNGGAVTTAKIADNAVTEDKLATAVQTKLSHAEDAYAAAVTNKTTAVASDNTNLITSAGVYANAKNASYNTAATNNIAANSTIGAAIGSLDTAIGDRQYATNGGYTGALLSDGQTVAASMLAVANQTDTNTATIGDVNYKDEAEVAGSVLKKGATASTNTVRGALDALDTQVSANTATIGTLVDGNHIAATNTIGQNLSALDTKVGTVTDGNVVLATNSVGANINALDTKMGTVANGAHVAAANTVGQNINALDNKIGTTTAGNFVLVANSVGQNLNALDNAIGDMGSLGGSHVTSGASVASNLDQLSLAIDAATTGAVAQAATYTDQRIESIDKNLSAGVAGAVALSSVAVSGVERGEVSVGAGYGYFNGQSAAAFGAAMGLSNRWSVNAGAGISNSDVSFRAGTNYKFKLF